MEYILQFRLEYISQVSFVLWYFSSVLEEWLTSFILKDILHHQMPKNICYTTNDVKLFETSKREDTDLFFRKRKWKHRQCNSQSRKSKNKKAFSCLTVVGTIFRQSVSKNYLCIFSKIKHHYLHPQKTLQSGRKVAYF